MLGGGGGVRIQMSYMAYILVTLTMTVEYFEESATLSLTSEFVTVEVWLGRWVYHPSLLFIDGLFPKF